MSGGDRVLRRELARRSREAQKDADAVQDEKAEDVSELQERLTKILEKTKDGDVKELVKSLESLLGTIPKEGENQK